MHRISMGFSAAGHVAWWVIFECKINIYIFINPTLTLKIPPKYVSPSLLCQ